MELKFYRCEKCGKMLITESELALDGWKEVIAGTTEAAREKHIPAVTVDGNEVKVCVGSVAHPMTAEHLIEWVAVETEQGYAVKYLKADSKPEATFVLSDGDKAKKVYAYCNLHGLWSYSL
ncbi:MAG TPA: desulfoferrodoxin [Candidatus Scatosoma pullicola]|nr:desulfoferrodoxin [Candidatus Scatosoma pullicola]